MKPITAWAILTKKGTIARYYWNKNLLIYPLRRDAKSVARPEEKVVKVRIEVVG